MDEHELIPYQTSDLRSERLLVLAPHPDDEILGCGGLVRIHRLEQRQVRVVVATDGTAASPGGGSSYSTQREDETVRGLAVLGVDDPPHFLRFPDRSLSARLAELGARLLEEIESFHPDLILLPSPVEIHPDHVALSRAFVDLLHSNADLATTLGITRVAFYEVSQPIRPNTLVDISAVAAAKQQALAEHRSQISIRDYSAYSDGLSRYRTMTLGGDVTHAEGYFVMAAAAVMRSAFGEIARLVAPAAGRIEVVNESLAVTTIVRTKDRLPLLREAVDSILAQSYPVSIVVVNDGGASPSAILRSIPPASLTLIEHPTPLGRAEAMNAGVRACASPWITFLDDDDLFEPEHVATLASAMGEGGPTLVYSDAVSVTMQRNESGRWEEAGRTRIYAEDFDRDLLAFDNYIPLPVTLTTREGFLNAGGFDPTFDLFEDWDFLLRLAALGSFRRVPRITCRIRHFPGEGSAVLSAPSGSSAFLAAKLKVWEHNPPSFDRLVTMLESQKRRLMASRSAAVEAGGRGSRLEIEIARLQRETQYLEQAEQRARASDEHARMTEARLIESSRAAQEALAAAQRAAERVGWLESGLEASHHRIGDYDARLRIAHEELARLGEELRGSHSFGESQKKALDELTAHQETRGDELRSAFAEIARLTSLVQAMESSKAWKFHQKMQRLKSQA